MPAVMRVYTKPGLTVSTWTPVPVSLARSPERNAEKPAFAEP